MKAFRNTVLVGSLVGMVIIGACSLPARRATPTQDIAPTVEAAIHATNTASAGIAATVEAAVQATIVAAQELTAAAPTDTVPVPTVAAAPPAPAVDISKMTEEELAVAIDTAVAEAVASTQQATAVTEASAADGSITIEETMTLEISWADAEEAIDLARNLIVAYNGAYGGYSLDVAAALQETVGYLDHIDEVAEAMLALLAQGSEAVSGAIQWVQSTLPTIQANTAGIRARAQGWLEMLQRELENRVAAALGVEPTEIATNRQEAIQSALAYLAEVRSSLLDSHISQEELSSIAQAGANAIASLKAHGGVLLGKVTGAIEALTAEIARGEWPKVQLNLGALESLLQRLP